MKNTNTARKYYALHWRPGYEFEYDYDTIPDIEIPVALILAFVNKQQRDYYVDRWYYAESIQAGIARKLIKRGVSYIEVGDER